MGKISQEQINEFVEALKKESSTEDLKKLIDTATKSDKKVRLWMNIFEIVITYLTLGLIWYNYGFGLAICIWLLLVSQVVGILKAVGKGNAISRLYSREGNVTLESVIEEYLCQEKK